ncbi:hypothetical protein Taro_051755 [Colocasia esculenta]|uniref:Uncharacterized protein n=1 Tax=Colocasia esculenta TaxID=4460 RepID=A0A843XGW7_COLES|nr:hypothetical protein [Colocasia esculenta]
MLLTTHGATVASATRPTLSSCDDEPLAEGSRGCNATTANRCRATHKTLAETNGVEHTAEATLGTPTETTEQPSENDVSPQARPPQTPTGSRPHKQNHPGPWTYHKVGKPHTPVPPWTGTLERDYGTERTPKRKPPEAQVYTRPDQRPPWELSTARLKPPCKLGQ